MNKKSLVNACIIELEFERDRLNTLALSHYILLINVFILSIFMHQMFLWSWRLNPSTQWRRYLPRATASDVSRRIRPTTRWRGHQERAAVIEIRSRSRGDIDQSATRSVQDPKERYSWRTFSRRSGSRTIPARKKFMTRNEKKHKISKLSCKDKKSTRSAKKCRYL